MSNKNITQLSEDQIQKINDFLNGTQNQPAMDENVFALFNSENPLIKTLVGNVRFVRGELIDPTKKYQTINGENYDDMVDVFKSTLNADDYSEDDYKQLVNDYRNECKRKIIHHGLVLNISNTRSVDLLVLNKDYEPIALLTEFYE